jgi:hypothetical protein
MTAQATPTAADFHAASSRLVRGPDARPDRKPKRNCLLEPEYRQISLVDLQDFTDQDVADRLARIRWGGHGEAVQACPKCGAIDKHHRCVSING